MPRLARPLPSEAVFREVLTRHRGAVSRAHEELGFRYEHRCHEAINKLGLRAWLTEAFPPKHRQPSTGPSETEFRTVLTVHQGVVSRAFPDLGYKSEQACHYGLQKAGLRAWLRSTFPRGKAAVRKAATRERKRPWTPEEEERAQAAIADPHICHLIFQSWLDHTYPETGITFLARLNRAAKKHRGQLEKTAKELALNVKTLAKYLAELGIRAWLDQEYPALLRRPNLGNHSPRLKRGERKRRHLRGELLRTSNEPRVFKKGEWGRLF